MAIPELQDTSGRLTDCIYFGDPISASVGSGFVPNARTINTTLPLTGGGDLSANRTLAINDFAGSVAGAVPASTGGVVTFLRADGAWATPPTFGAAAAGYAPASGGGATNYLRADGTWAAPPGSGGGGLSGLTLGYVPVATSATSVADSRIYESATGYDIVVDPVGGTTGAGSRLHINYEPTAYGPVIRSSDLVGGIYVSGTRVAGGGASTAYFEAIGDRVYIAGQVAYAEVVATASNGPNPFLASSGVGTNVRIIGPTTAFSVGGLSADDDGAMRWYYNTTSQSMTIVNEDITAIATARILTLTGGDVVLPASTSSFAVVYSATDQRWILVGTSPSAQYPRTIGYIPFENAAHNLADSYLNYDSANQRFGFRKPTPVATVDINGTIATVGYSQVLAAGLNSNIPAPTTSLMRVTGPAAAFSVGGIIADGAEDGKRLTIHNSTVRAMTIVNEDLSSTAAYRILTNTGANVTLPTGRSAASLTYDTVSSRWILDSTSAGAAAGATTQIQYNNAGTLGASADFVVTFPVTGAAVTLGTDTSVSKKATRQLELGTPNAAPSAYILTGNSSIGGTDSNKRGGKLSVGGGAGTGDAGGGDTALVTAYQGSLGNTQNTLVDRAVVAAKYVTLTESSATKVMTVGVAAGEGAAGTLWYSIFASDATDRQMRRGRVIWSAVNKSGTVTPVLGTPEEAVAASAGTLTVTVTAVDSTANGVDFKLNAVSSLTQTSLYAWVSMDHDGKGAVTTV